MTEEIRTNLAASANAAIEELARLESEVSFGRITIESLNATVAELTDELNVKDAEIEAMLEAHAAELLSSQSLIETLRQRIRRWRRKFEREVEPEPAPASAVLGWNRVDPRFHVDREYFVDHVNATILQEIIDRGQMPVISIRHDKDSPTAWRDLADGLKDDKIRQWRNALAAVAPNEVWVAYWAEQTGYATGIGGRGPSGTLAEWQDAHRRVFTMLADLEHVKWANCLMNFDTRGILAGDPKYVGADVPDIPFDMYAIDTYGTDPQEEYGPIVRLARERGAVPSIWETGCTIRDPLQHADWILRVGDYVEANGINALMFFDGGDEAFRTFNGPEDHAAIDELASRPYFTR